MEARRLHRDDVARFAHRADAHRQGLVAAGGDHHVAGGGSTAGVHQQAGDFLAQQRRAVDPVVGQRTGVGVAVEPGQAAGQRFQRRAGDVRHAAAELDHVRPRYRADQGQHLLPLRDFHRPLGQAGDRRQRRHLSRDRYEIAGLRPRLGQPAIFQQPVCLLHGAQADAVLDAHGPHRGQPVARTVEALFDARTEGLGELQIKGHERDSRVSESGTGTDGGEIHHSGRGALDLYAVNPPFLDLYGTARDGHSISVVQPINMEYAA